MNLHSWRPACPGALLVLGLLLACDPGENDTFPRGSMIRVPAGQFEMGQLGVARAEPVHVVTLSHDFLLGRTEVSNAEYQAALQWAYDNDKCWVEQDWVQLPLRNEVRILYYMGTPASEIGFENGRFQLKRASTGINALSPGYDPGPHPVMMVTWLGAATYCDWLSQIGGLPLYYEGGYLQSASHDPYRSGSYRLPTEAEWERAARYDDGRTWPWGEVEVSSERANHLGSGWSMPVGSYPGGRSRLGFDDMAGNVWEWVGDRFGPYGSFGALNPLGYQGVSSHVIRGGYWANGPNLLRCAARLEAASDGDQAGIGFRICRTVP